jgi:Bacterial PH domain
MKPIGQINLEVENIFGKETFIKKKEFSELTNLLDESDTILDVVSCTKIKPSAMAGILVTTNNRILFITHSVFSGTKKNEFQFANILDINSSKGMMFSKLGLKYENNEIEFDYILNKYVQHTVQQIELRIKNAKEVKIEEKLIQENNVELTPLEKIKFKKFLGEQGGMTISEVDNFLSVTPQNEIHEIIKDFKKSSTGHLKQDISVPKIQSTPQTQVVKVMNDDPTLPTCPKCKSKQVNIGKQGFGVGKAFVGAVLTGGIGLLAGGINKNKLILTCLNCGHHWTK